MTCILFEPVLAYRYGHNVHKRKIAHEAGIYLHRIMAGEFRVREDYRAQYW